MLVCERQNTMQKARSRIQKPGRYIPVITLVASMLTCLGLREYFKPVELETPIPLGGEIQAYAKEIEPTITAGHVEFTLDQVVEYIWERESSKGKNNPPHSLASNCYAKGKWNELGYGGMENPKCFANKEEGMATVNRWVEKRLNKQTMNIAQVLCTYRHGTSDENCEYGQTFLARVTK